MAGGRAVRILLSPGGVLLGEVVAGMRGFGEETGDVFLRFVMLLLAWAS